MESLYTSVHSSEHNLLIVPEMIWGGPVTAIIIEELFTLGVRKLIGFGAAGSINPSVQPGTMFVAEKTFCIDGTSKEYTNQEACHADPTFLDYYLRHSEESDAIESSHSSFSCLFFACLNELCSDAPSLVISVYSDPSNVTDFSPALSN